MSLRSMLNSTVDLDAPSDPTKDAYGGFSDTVNSASLPASVQLDTTAAALQYQRETDKRKFNVYVESNTDIKDGTRVTVTGSPYTGLLLTVVSAKADHAGRSTYWMLSCTEAT